MSKSLEAACGLGAVVGAGWLIHRLGRRSGASAAEARQQLPGDEVVGRPQWQSTRAVTIAASPAEVWPWVVQMGFPGIRAGWYTPYWLDRLVWRTGARSADGIIPELQELEVGDEVPDSADGSVFWTVEAIAPERHLVLRTTRHIIPPIRTVDSSWAVALKPVGGDKTRLYLRARAVYTPRWIVPFVELVIGPADWLNAASMLVGIRRRAEGR
jgi:hypothetical protein